MSSNNKEDEFYRKDVTCTQEYRLMSPTELVYFKLNDTTISNFIQANIFASKISIPIEKVREALRDLSKYHFLLQAKVDKQENEGHIFKKMENCSENDDWIILKVFSANNSNEWPNIATKDAEIAFDMENGPLWRVIWVECQTKTNNEYTYVMIFICSHAVIDAKSSVDLVSNQFLPILNGLLNEKSFILSEKPIFFAEPFESVFTSEPLKYSVSECRSPWYIKFPLYIGLKLFKFFGSKHPEIKVYHEEKKDGKFGMHPFSLDAGTCLKLITTCKNNGVSVHSVLMMILAYSLKTLENEYEHLKLKFNAVNYPIDYRKFNKNLDTSPQPLGVYTIADGHKIKFIDPKDTGHFFKFCQSLTQKIRKGNKPKVSDLILSVINELNEQNRVVDLMKCFSVNLSNLGNCDKFVKSDPNSAVRLCDHYFGVVVKDIIQVTCNTINEKMYFCICYDGRWVSVEFVSDLGRIMKEFILAVSQ